MTKPHLWQGNWINDEELRARVPQLRQTVENALRRPLETSVLLRACKSVNDSLTAENRQEFEGFLETHNLEKKLTRELGSAHPFEIRRNDYKTPCFESWAPLGLLVHVAPTNATSVGALSVVEGLLAGNACFLKTGGSDSLFAQNFLKALSDADDSGVIASYVFAARIPSTEKELLRQIFSAADGIAVWGGQSAVESVRLSAPPLARFIAWGPKISFAFVARESLEDERIIRLIAKDICNLDQQACSSPQCIFVETASQKETRLFGRRLAEALDEVSPSIPRKTPTLHEQAEITTTTELCRLRLPPEDVIVTESDCRIFIDSTPELNASPLFRSVWLKSASPEAIPTSLAPNRHLLQTAGLACGPARLNELSELLLRAGVLRITPVGAMLESYMGEPHDGEYALQRYCRRVSIQLEYNAPGVSSFSELKVPAPPNFRDRAPSILTKAEFQKQVVPKELAHLYFKSGGTSGAPALSVFTYDDYHLQMRAAADGLFAAGLDPKTDRCMNLFSGGNLYGGFISFFTVLETLSAVQFPMAAQPDLSGVVRTIIMNDVNVLLGMPSYLLRLFQENERELAQYRKIKKIFYGGEHLNQSQKKELHEKFGIEIIRSASYGSVDAGPIGYQCPFCEGTVHHLHAGLHEMEVVTLESEAPAQPGTPGRLLLTSLARHGQDLSRYEIGDLVRQLSEPCPCGRQSPRFELLGRHGDVFRVGATFLNYQKFARTLGDRLGYAGELQIILTNNPKENLLVRSSCALPPEAIKDLLLSHDKDLHEAVCLDQVLELEIVHTEPGKFEYTPTSGKLRRIIDRREIS